MRKFILVALSLFFLISCELHAQKVSFFPDVTPEGKGKVITWIDNTGYWKRMTVLGYVNPGPVIPFKPALFTTEKVTLNGRFVMNSPDVPITGDPEVTQSENSVFVNPLDDEMIFNSNNSADTSWSFGTTFYGSDHFLSDDAALSWEGSVEGAGESNNGDPSTVAGLNGWWYIGLISNDLGQKVSYSKDQGATWTPVTVAPGPGDNYVLDKNHLWIDNSPSSPYQGNLYDAWTMGDPLSADAYDVQLARSTDQGISWKAPVNISDAVNAGYFNHGVNIHTGPYGEVYATWAIYDTWPANENAIGFARSTDGGAAFEPARRIIENIRGIRYDGTSKLMRVNSFPSMAVDISGGLFDGTIYIVWANQGYPGVNLYDDIDIYMIKSQDKGETWSPPVKVNQDYPGIGKQHFFPWITCDPDNGNLCVVYYDDRNVAPENCETFISYSYDGGDTWSDMKVSDVIFTPSPIPGLAAGYFGDYIGITSKNMKVYPVWTDNRTGEAKTYVSPVDLGPAPNQPYIVYHSCDLATIAGETGRTLDYGDSLRLSLSLKNIGDQQVNDVTVTLSSPSPWIVITDSLHHFAHFNPGETVLADTAYTIRISDTIPDGLRVRFDIRASVSSDSVWYSHFGIESHAPGPLILGYTILDTLNGNRDGRPDPGEEIIFRLAVRNRGDFSCPLTTGIMESTYQFLFPVAGTLTVDSIPPGDTIFMPFRALIGNEATTGVPLYFTFQVISGLYHDMKSCRDMIGSVSEDWETHSFSKFPWVTTGDKPWIISTDDPYQGSYCTKSGWVYDLENSELYLTYESSVDDSISFYRKVSCEEQWDHLAFYIDNDMQGAWSGETPWGRVAYPVSAGKHTFGWVYEKDISVTTGEDRAWVDLIDFPPPLLPVVSAGPYDTVCAGDTLVLQGSASGYDSLEWKTNGDGTFSDPHSLNPVYHPGNNDLFMGKATLKLTAFSPKGNVAAFMVLTILSLPQVAITAEPGDTVCSWGTIILRSNASGVDSFLWKPGNLTEPDIELGLPEVGSPGSYWFSLTASGNNGCLVQDSILIHFKDCLGLADPAPDFSADIYPNPNQGVFLLHIASGRQISLDLRLFNSLNISLYEEKGWVIPGNSYRQIDFSSFKPGFYLLELSGNSSKKIFRLLIQ